MPVVATIVVTALLFIPLAVICRRFDKRDKTKWTILPLVDNYPNDEQEYELHVYTGFKNKGVTKSNIKFIVHGTDGNSGIRVLRDGIREHFKRGEINSFLMKTPVSLGDPYAIQIWHDNAGDGKNAGWFLDKVVLVDRKAKKWYVFWCLEWLAVDEGDFLTERYLKVSSDADSDVTSDSLLGNNINRKLFDDHIWLSVGIRKNKSTFTRVQRLACCFAILFLAMVINAMWYGTEDENTTRNAITIGPISFSTHELFTSIVSSIIILPPSLFIITFFAKSAPKPPTDDGGKIISGYTRPRGKLPYWCAYLAWAVTALCIIVCVFFAIMYSLEFDKGKSTAWLLAFILSFVESVILIQPLKVIFMAILLTFIFKQDSDIGEYELVHGKRDGIYKGGQEFTRQSHISPEREAELRLRTELDKKMRNMLREIAYFVIFLALLIAVCNGNQNENVFHQNQDLRNSFTNILGRPRIKMPMDIYKWMKTYVIPSLYLTEDYHGNVMSEYDEKFLSNMNAMRLGSPRLRQLRVRNETCIAPSQSYTRDWLASRCTLWYSIKDEDRHDYSPSWSSKGQNTTSHELNSDTVEKAFNYQTETELRGDMFWAYIETYSGGGYVANLENTAEKARKVIEKLEETNWLDERTRAVFLEFNAWNANTNLFNMFILVLEFTPIGDMFYWSTVDSIQLYRYAGGGGVVALLLEIACIIFVIISAVLEIRKMVKFRRQYFKQFWSVLFLFALLFFIVALGFYVNRSLWTIRLVEEVMNNRGKTVNFRPLAFSNDMFMTFLGLTSFVVQMHLLHLLRYNNTIAMLGATLAKSAPVILNFSVCAGLLFMAFVSGTHKLFWGMESYMTLRQTMSSLVEAFLGKFDFVTLIAMYGLPGGLFLLLYLCTMIFLVVNMFVVILDEFIHVVKEDDTHGNQRHEVIEHLLEVFKGLVIKKNPVKAKVEEDKDPEYRTEDLAERIDVLDWYLESYMAKEEEQAAVEMFDFLTRDQYPENNKDALAENDDEHSCIGKDNL